MDVSEIADTVSTVIVLQFGTGVPTRAVGPLPALSRALLRSSARRADSRAIVRRPELRDPLPRCGLHHSTNARHFALRAPSAVGGRGPFLALLLDGQAYLFGLARARRTRRAASARCVRVAARYMRRFFSRSAPSRCTDRRSCSRSQENLMQHTNLFAGACSSCGTAWSCTACMKTRDCVHR